VRRTTKTVCGEPCATLRRERKLDKGRRRYRETFVPVEVTNPVVHHKCIECGSSFTTNRYSTKRKYCSPPCSSRAAHRHRRHLERAAQRMGELFTTREIADRDGWRCHICHLPIPDRRTWTNSDDDPTIDHLVPLSMGGAHVRVNVAIAHRICNSRRGTGGTTQLRLVG
jgi:5-methylcytosine-specific restriction endonuclease McrA